MCVPIGAVAVYVRYRQVAEHLSEDSVHSDRLNKAALVIGVAAAFSITIVANFPVCCFVKAKIHYTSFPVSP